MTGSKVNDILVFLAVVEAGSFVAGGRACGLSRSAAGKAVARLENSYGVRLLNRTTRTFSLTEEGRRLYEHGQTIRSVIEATDASLSIDPGTPSGTLRITAPDALGRKLLMPVVKQYLQEWPGTRIEASFNDRIENVVEGGFDLAVRIGMTSPNAGLIARTLFKDKPVLCAAPSYFDNLDRPRLIEHLGTHDLLQFSSRGERQGWTLQENTGLWTTVQGHVRLKTDSAEALRDAALEGLGIALLPESLIARDIASGRLEQVLPGINAGHVPVMVLYPHRRYLQPRVRHFIDMLVEKTGSTGMP
ncbi:MAG: LysR substrate-binding domain-containing protein [Sneathiellales bacterium]|nr:LysR substrate-binding domain-containing protein [Sneathiellales bacterium]